VIVREVVNGLMYVLSTGCQWRAIPKDLPQRSRPQRTE
jgi:transposase